MGDSRPMIDLESLNPYEILDVDPRATVAEIKRAFQIAVKTYGPGHMATASIFTEEQREQILNKVHEAYNILMDPERRRQWDDILRQKGLFPLEVEPPVRPIPLKEPPTPSTIPKPKILELQKREDMGDKEEKARKIAELLEGARAKGQWSGNILRQAREIMGLTVEDVAQKTKIGRGHIRSIEEDSYTFLPPDVYVKGFITQIAKTVGVDPEVIVPPLMEKIRRTRGPR